MKQPASKRPKIEHDDNDDHEMMMAEAVEDLQVEDLQPPSDNEPSDPPPPVLSQEDPSHLNQFNTSRRPKAEQLDSTKHPLVVMQVDASKSSTLDTDGSAIIQMFGITEQGHSVLLRVHHFYHYFYVPIWPGVSPASLIAAIHKKLWSQNLVPKDKKVVQDIEIVTKRSIMNYVPGNPVLEFYKITLINPDFMKDVSQVLRTGGLQVMESNKELITMPEMLTYDATLDFILRFMIQVDLVGCSWLTIPPKKYKVATAGSKKSLLQYEIDVEACNIRSHKPEGKWLTTAPMRRLSFDIECEGRKGVFPEPQHDSVIQIANYIWEHGSKEPVSKVIFTLKSCAAIVGAEVYSFEEESKLLAAWSRFVRASDPDILTGYNIVNFDLPYLLDRAEALEVKEFPYLGRMAGKRTTMRKTRMSSSAFGTHESRSFSMDGRIVFDMLQLITREYKLRSYSLNSVSAEFLGQQKEDVHYSIISDLQKGDEQTRRRLAVYCLKDALLPVRLMDKLMSLTNYMEMARVTGIPLGWLVSRGHMIKVVSLLHKKSHEVDLVIPDMRNFGAGGKSADGGPQFEGATVIEPQKGMYYDPIATLDFASLYPSIIMAHNLCYSTLVRDEHKSRLKPEDYSISPSGACFVKKSVKKGILTNILEELLAARKQAKKDLKEAEDPFLKSVLNGRQLALKISANAVYGFTGASVGKLPCMAISASTTAYGRQMIEKTKEEVEKRYKGANVVYGDTDSVMIKFGAGKSLQECMKLGEEAAQGISEIFPKPVKLEFEKCYHPYLLINKKRYAGLIWTNTESYEKMDCKGIESVRRDNCRLVANVISSSLEILLKKRDTKMAVDMVKKVISDLLQNKIDVSLLVVSKALTKTDYENKQAHVELAEKMRKRDPGTAPSLGDRVPYVIIKGTKNEPAYSRSEDPLYVLENNIPIDNNYYLENMLRKPLERIFEPILDSTSSLFAGDHTRTISVVTPKKGVMMRFAKVRLTCLGCKSTITEGAICKYCVPREAEIYSKNLKIASDLEKVYSSLWTECQRCMGDVCHDVLCSNGDCPIFYRRRKAQKDLDVAAERLARFDIEW